MNVLRGNDQDCLRAILFSQPMTQVVFSMHFVCKKERHSDLFYFSLCE